MAGTIQIKGFEECFAKIEDLKQMKPVKAALKQVGEHIKGKVDEYPPESHRPQPFKSDKQRRHFFWMLHQGLIEVPYRRGQSPGSQHLGDRWTVSTRNWGLTVVVGNNVSYGAFVQDADKQSLYHQETGWKTIQKVMEEEDALVVQVMNDFLTVTLNK